MKIIYKSKYGAAEKYAEMLGKTLSCEVIDLKKAAKGETDVIFVGAVYGGEIRGFDKLVKKRHTSGCRVLRRRDRSDGRTCRKHQAR